MTSAIMAFLHHIFAFALTASLVYEFVAFRRNITIEEARRLQLVDLAYGISAGFLLIVGLLRVFYFEKGAGFYAQNPFFWLKMVMFAIVGLLSIDPTIRYLRWNKLLKEDQPPVTSEAEFKRIRLLLWLEVIGLVVILFSAALMARGIGI
jgi:putative membrane protein